MTMLAALQGLTDSMGHNPVVAVLSLFGAGLLTSLTPCIYPMIPITASVIAGTAGENSGLGRRIGLTAAYISGLALLYASMGLVAGLTGSLFGTIASHPVARLAIAGLLIVFALAMFDIIRVVVPRSALAWASSLPGGNYPAVFVLGAASGIVAAPCGAPAFAAVLTWVATTGSAVLGFLYLLVFSLGMGAVLAAVGVSSGALALLPKSGVWTVWIKRGAGVILLGVAAYYLWLAATYYFG